MSLHTATPPLLLTKRLTAFLHSNLSPSLNAALLTTPSGKLLAHAATTSAHTSAPSSSSSSSHSASPTNTTAAPPTATPPSNHKAAGPQAPPAPRPGSVALLRTQATVAASLYALHASSAPTIPDALPGSRRESPPDSATGGNSSIGGSSSSSKPLTITVQLSQGIMVIRRLKCGLLFVCLGPVPEASSDSTAPSAQAQNHGGIASYSLHSASSNNAAAHGSGSGSAPTSGGGTAAAAAATSGSGGGLGVPGAATSRGQGHASPSHVPASPSEADSVLSTGAASAVSVGSSVAGSVGAAAAVSMRRHAEDLARWLDDKLGTLRIPEEGVGSE